MIRASVDAEAGEMENHAEREEFRVAARPDWGGSGGAASA